MLLYQHLRALNDPNGNPQRLWVVYALEPGARYTSTRVVIDEGYGNLPAFLADAVPLPAVDISRSDYHRRCRIAKAEGKLVQAE